MPFLKKSKCGFKLATKDVFLIYKLVGLQFEGPAIDLAVVCSSTFLPSQKSISIQKKVCFAAKWVFPGEK